MTKLYTCFKRKTQGMSFERLQHVLCAIDKHFLIEGDLFFATLL